MKKLLLSGLALTFCLAAVAQRPTSTTLQSRLNATITNKAVKLQKPSEVYAAPVNAVNPTVHQARTSSMVEVGIGTTSYDLQANYGSPGQRIFLWNDNTISAIWTFSTGFAVSPPERGTGYNYYDGSSWGAIPTARIESYKTGFSSLGASDALGEVVVNHGANGSLMQPCTTSSNKFIRTTKGTGAWAESPLSCNSVIWWPRVAVGGAAGTTIHAMGNDNVTTGGSVTNYSRSTDGGANWVNDNILLPDFATDMYEGPVDAYQIVTRGDVVAIAMGGWIESLILWKSTDNGNTWVKTIVNEFPLAPYPYNQTNVISDTNTDGIADTILTTDSGIALAIDNNNMVHLAVGLTRVLDTDTTSVIASSTYSYFPGTDGLVYWNESMPAGDITPNIIAFVEDIDGSTVIEIPDGLAIYQCGLTSMATLGVDASNNIHLAYTSLIENTTNGNNDPALEEAFRNVYSMHSTDGGANWSLPTRVALDDFAEQVWPSMAAKVNNRIHLVYHKDDEPGNTYQPSANSQNIDTPDPFTTVDVIYNDVVNPVGVAEINSALLSTVVYPNPVLNVMNVDFNLENAQVMTISLVDVLGQTVYTSEYKAQQGVNNFKLNVRNFAPGIYSLNTTVENNIFSEKVIIQ